MSTLKNRLLPLPILPILCLILFLVTGCAESRFDADGIESIVITADPGMMTPVRDSGEGRDAFAQLLKAASKPSVLPSLPVMEASVTAAVRQKDGGKGEAAYVILRDGERYYARSGELLLQIDGDAYLSLLGRYGGEYYLYSGLPECAVSVNGGNEIPLDLAESSYYYRAADGSRPAVDYTPASGSRLSLKPGDMLEAGLSRRVKELGASLFLAGEQVWSGPLPELSAYEPPAPGEYTLELKAAFRDLSDYYGGEAIWRTAVDWQLDVSFEVRGDQTFPGEALVLRARNVPEGEEVKFISDMAFRPAFFDDGAGGRFAFLPISTATAPNSYSFILQCGEHSAKFIIQVQDKKFQIQNLDVDSSTAQETVYSQQANAEFYRVIEPLKTVSDDRAHWQGGFLLPLESYRLTTEFGMIRYVNGAPTSSRHNAMDMAAPTGTPVMAAGAGRVLYAGFLQLTGNTVLIEHGFGLKSWYYHMDSLAVSTGDMVEKGQKIGEVGSTGFSTGPHLHFGMSVNNVFVNPETFIDGKLLD